MLSPNSKHILLCWQVLRSFSFCSIVLYTLCYMHVLNVPYKYIKYLFWKSLWKWNSTDWGAGMSEFQVLLAPGYLPVAHSTPRSAAVSRKLVLTKWACSQLIECSLPGLNDSPLIWAQTQMRQIFAQPHSLLISCLVHLGLLHVAITQPVSVRNAHIEM